MTRTVFEKVFSKKIHAFSKDLFLQFFLVSRGRASSVFLEPVGVLATCLPTALKSCDRLSWTLRSSGAEMEGALLLHALSQLSRAAVLL